VKTSTEKMNGSPTAVLSPWSCLIRINIEPAPAGTSPVPTSGEVLANSNKAMYVPARNYFKLLIKGALASKQALLAGLYAQTGAIPPPWQNAGVWNPMRGAACD